MNDGTVRSHPSAAEVQARVAALQAMAVLDTPPEETFDALARLAASVCDMPIAIIRRRQQISFTTLMDSFSIAEWMMTNPVLPRSSKRCVA